MRKLRTTKLFFPVILLFMAFFVIQPALGVSGSITVGYRGSGENTIGDTVIFDGMNTLGNTTLIKISGPGLPAEGVPLYDFNGAPGSGNIAEVGPDGLWKFAWYTSTIRGIEKIQTARYTITVSSLFGGRGASSTSIIVKKPDLSITPYPNPVTPGKYVELTGVAEQTVDTVSIEVADSAGTVLHSFTSPVSASGYLNYGFHVDMPPGQYTITVSNPAMGNPYRTFLSVIPPPVVTPATPNISLTTDQGVTTANLSTASMNNGSNPETVSQARSNYASRTPASSLTVIGGIIIGGMIMILSSSGRKDH